MKEVYDSEELESTTKIKEVMAFPESFEEVSKEFEEAREVEELKL